MLYEWSIFHGDVKLPEGICVTVSIQLFDTADRDDRVWSFAMGQLETGPLWTNLGFPPVAQKKCGKRRHFQKKHRGAVFFASYGAIKWVQWMRRKRPMPSDPSWQRLSKRPDYPLVMTNIAIENHHFLWENPLFLWPFSSSLCLFTRGYQW